MAYLFIDESGDLGKHPRSTKYFIVAGIISNEARKIEKKLFAVRKSIRKIRKSSGELHANHAEHNVRLKVLKSLTSLSDSVCAYAFVFKKSERVPISYDKILLHFLKNILPHEDIYTIYADIYDPKKSRRNEVERMIKETFLANKINLIFTPSHHVKSIQAADFIAWALFQKYEHDDDSFYKIIEPIIKKIFFF